MLLDGIYVMLRGKYIGPEKPGPWASIFTGFNIDPFRLGPVFIAFGLAWIGWLVIFWMKDARAFSYGVVIIVLTLWYLPIGTLFSILILVVLIYARRSLFGMP